MKENSCIIKRHTSSSFAMEKYQFSFSILHNRDIVIALKSQVSASTHFRNDAIQGVFLSRSLLNDFYINGNKILLSGITNGVSRAVKIVRGTRNWCARRASVLNVRASIQENYCSSSRVS